MTSGNMPHGHRLRRTGKITREDLEPVTESSKGSAPRMNGNTLPREQSDDGLNERKQTRNLDERFPRVEMTPSMLHAYALMRGKCDRQGDPVHFSLFQVRERGRGAYPVWIPGIRERGSIGELPRGAVLFWDPLLQKLPSPPPVSVLDPDPNLGPRRRLTFLEHLRQFPKTVGRNHYKGDQVYENFGYVCDKDTKQWIDPDAPGLLKYEHMPGDRTSDGNQMGGDVPSFQLSQDTGPQAMGRQEEDEFYSEYTKYVSDEVDGEGDPRNHRITPATFARWAEGARKCRQYEEELYKPDSQIWSKNIVLSRDIPKKQPDPTPVPLYDLVDGELFDTYYEDEENPSLMIEPEGVDVLSMPNHFSKCQPILAQKFNHLAFGGSLVLENEASKEACSQPPSTDSTPSVFKDYAIGKLGDPEVPGSGAAEHEFFEVRLISLRQKYLKIRKKALLLDNKVSKKQAHKVDHERDAYFLKLHKGENPLTYKSPPGDRVPKRMGYYQLESSSSDASLAPTELEPSTPKSSANQSINREPGTKEKRSKHKPQKYPIQPVGDEELAALLKVPPEPRRRKKTQYQRYFDEAYEYEVARMNEMETWLAARTKDYVEIKEAIAEARAEKDALVQSYGVYRMEDIPNLQVPRPGVEERAELAVDPARQMENGKHLEMDGDDGPLVQDNEGLYGVEDVFGVQDPGIHRDEEHTGLDEAARRQRAKGKGREEVNGMYGGGGVWQGVANGY